MSDGQKPGELSSIGLSKEAPLGRIVVGFDKHGEPIVVEDGDAFLLETVKSGYVYGAPD